MILIFFTALSLSLRLDSDYAATREFFTLYPMGYYQKGLSFLIIMRLYWFLLIDWIWPKNF